MGIGGLILTIIIFAAYIIAVIPALIRTPVVRQFPKGHVHQYDPTGRYTYRHQNPEFK